MLRTIVIVVVVAGCGGNKATTDAAIDATSCPADYTLVGNAHYKLLGTLEYGDAKTMCAADQQHIMVVDSASEATDVIIFLAMPSLNPWAGVEGIGNNMFQTALGVPATYLPWDVDEPSTSAAGSCAVVEGSGLAAGSYFMDDCTMMRTALCECD